MSEFARCIKTGCALKVPEGTFWGDAFLDQVGGVLIFNAAANDQGRPHDYSAVWTPTSPTWTLVPDASYFHRRGVFVLPFHLLQQNAALAAHFVRWPL